MTVPRRSRDSTEPVGKVPPEGGTIWPNGYKPDYVINPETGCWNWLKSVNRRGYGYSNNFKWLGFSTTYAHRVYYMLANGLTEIDRKIDVHHLCRNPSCVNPAHLEMVEHREHLKRHKRADNTNLTEADVAEIMRLASAAPVIPLQEIADRFNVKYTVIAQMTTGLTWHKQRAARPVTFCWQCGEQLHGRRNQRYCDTLCQSRYLNALKKAQRHADKAA